MKIFIVNSKPYDEDYVYSAIKKVGGSTTSFPHKADLILAIGGDAAVLKTVEFCDFDIPILAYNTGTLGFLSNDIELGTLLSYYTSGDLVSDRRSLLRVMVDSDPSDRVFLNEVAILGIESGKMVNATLSIDGMYVTDYMGDGVIISTPSGSTAWSLSCGGPIIEPDVGGILITPSNPFSINHRPLLVSDRRVITLGGIDKIVIDGNTTVYTNEVTIRDDGDALYLIKPKTPVTFYDRIQSKLGWAKNIKH